jgi:diguanylate cyclase (GGDEF)-like protein
VTTKVAPAESDSEETIAALSDELARLRRENMVLRMANEELERVVVRDTLTPLYNRRYFITCLNDRINRLQRYDAPAVVVFIDVDGLKAVNDHHGHCAGDYVLLHVAQMLAGAIRTTDVAARIGGDEFALILDAMSEQDAGRKIAGLEQLVRDTPCDFDEVQLAVAASFGFTGLLHDDSDFSVIARADKAMYAAKHARRNG